MKIKRSKSRIVFSFCNGCFFMLFILLCAYPIWYILIQSLSGSIVSGKAVFVPYRFTLDNYRQVFALQGVFHAFLISVLRTVIGAGLSITCCMLLGYLFSKEDMPFRKFLYRMLVITMYVSGGLIPTYLTIKTYGLLNNFWVYILPMMISAYYVILIKTYVEQLPPSVEESAMLDGAGTLTIFARIIVPMSLPILATIAVYACVAQWNAWFDNRIYNFRTENLTTMQYMLYKYLSEAERLSQMLAISSQDNEAHIKLTPQGVRMTVTMITVIPVLLIYPILQRFFIKGIMIGAVKG